MRLFGLKLLDFALQLHHLLVVLLYLLVLAVFGLRQLGLVVLTDLSFHLLLHFFLQLGLELLRDRFRGGRDTGQLASRRLVV